MPILRNDLAYPQNLYFAILGETFKPDRDRLRGLAKVSSENLTDIERQVLCQRYRRHLDYSAIGVFLGLTESRVKQIDCSSCQKLSVPIVANYIRFGLQGYFNMLYFKRLDARRKFTNTRLLSDFDLGVRALTGLSKAGIITVGDLEFLVEDSRNNKKLWYSGLSSVGKKTAWVGV